MKKSVFLCLVYIIVVFFIKSRFSFSLNISFFISLVLFVAGGALGYLLYYANYFLYPYLSEKTDELALKTEEYYQKKEFVMGIKFVELNEEKMTFQILKSALNMGILLILTVFISSSSGSFFGSGVCFGLLFHFNMKLWEDFKRPLALNQWFEWVKKPVEEKYQRLFVIGAMGLSILISL